MSRIVQYNPKIMHTKERMQEVSGTARARKPLQEVKMSYFCGLLARTIEMQEVESLMVRSGRKLKILAQDAGGT